MPDRTTKQHISPQEKKNMLLVALLGQIGVLTLVIVLAAAFGGLALDAKLGTKPWFTIGLLIASIPVSLFIMIWISRKTITKIKATNSATVEKEETIGKEA
ncbi:MAG TPA: AtpZ/AtpI family protein [Anaerolineaceae bacterium]|nr:AtpZ/AtpI family protein [Anaerolineaceae bacterium]